MYFQIIFAGTPQFNSESFVGYFRTLCWRLQNYIKVFAKNQKKVELIEWVSIHVINCKSSKQRSQSL